MNTADSSSITRPGATARAACLCAALAFSAGCATTREYCTQHPVVCGVAAGVLVTGIALAAHHEIDHGNDYRTDIRARHGNPCRPGDAGCPL